MAKIKYKSGRFTILVGLLLLSKFEDQAAKIRNKIHI